MSQQESKEVSKGLKGGLVVAALLAIVLIAAPKHEALQAISIVQAATTPQSGSVGGNGPTGYFPDRFRDANGEDVPQPDAF
jgi:hypothetical protein